MRYQKILVTGGSGRLGRYVTHILSKRCDLTVLDRVPAHLETRVIEADVTNYNALRDAFRTQEAIIHLAAIPDPRTAPADVTFQTNVQERGPARRRKTVVSNASSSRPVMLHWGYTTTHRDGVRNTCRSMRTIRCVPLISTR